MEKTTKRKAWTQSTWLIALCWLVYSCSYIGKVNYKANITQVETFFGVTHAEAGLVDSFFFFAYAIGQVVNGLCCKKYNLRYVVFGSLIASGLINLAIAVTTNFAIIKYLWMINGFALSILWPSLIRLLSETMPKGEMAKASVAMGTTVAVGTLIIYCLSSIYALFNAFKLAFYTAAIVAPTVAIIWMIFYNRLTKKERVEEEQTGETPSAPANSNVQQKSAKPTGQLLAAICCLALFSVATNLIADGLTTWVPSILKGNFGLSDSLSIVLTLVLPLLSVFGNLFAVNVHKKVPDFVTMCALFFFVSGILICIILGLFTLKGTFVIVMALACFALVRALVGSSNSTITSIFPLFMRGKVNSGQIAGVLNGFCYIGSTISSYGLGLIADLWGWNAVFYVLLGACVLVVLVAIVYNIGLRISAKKEQKSTA